MDVQAVRKSRILVIIAALALVVGIAPLLPPIQSAHASTFTPNIYGQLRNAYDNGPTNISAIQIFEVTVSGSPSTMTRTLVATSSGDDSVTVQDDTFIAYVDFQQGLTYEMDVVPVDNSAGGTTTFRLPGPAGSGNQAMAFRLQDPGNPGLLFRTRQWACRADDDVNCVEGLRARTTAGPGSWVAGDDSSVYPTYTCDGSSDCSVNGNGDYTRWDQYQTWDLPTVGAVNAQSIRVQFGYRPEETQSGPDPAENPYPYMTIEMGAQDTNGYDRDGWGCDTLGDNDTWWAPGDSWDDTPYPTWLTEVSATFGCGGNTPLEPALDYEVSLRTAESTFIPMFTAGYLAGMESALTFDNALGAYSMTISGAPRAWQWIGGDVWRDDTTVASDDSQSYANYFDATNRDWTFSTYDGRIISNREPALSPCIGLGMAASSTNGNGGYIPTWDGQTQSINYNTDGRHFMPANIDDSGDPTAPTSAGLVYIGKAEMVIPTPLALCMWADAGFTTVADLQNLAGQVKGDSGGLKANATVTTAVDDTAMYVDASGYTYSLAKLVVAPAVGASPLGQNLGSVSVGDEAFAEFEVTNNDTSNFVFPAAPTTAGTNAADFTIISTMSQCYDDSATLQPGETCRIAVSFAPSAAGVRQAYVSFGTTPTLGGPHELSLQGTGVAVPVPPAPVSPSAPLNVTATAGDASATVSWSPPATSGSYAVTQYKVTSSPAGGSCLVTGLTCTVEKLTNGKSYTFTVEALSGAGWSPVSAPSNAVTPTAPEPPVEMRIQISGTRGEVRGKPGVIVTGETTGFEMGAVLKPWIKFPGQTNYAEGSASILVDEAGDFTWSRRTGKKIYIIVKSADGAVKSNRLIIEAR